MAGVLSPPEIDPGHLRSSTDLIYYWNASKAYGRISL